MSAYLFPNGKQLLYLLSFKGMMSFRSGSTLTTEWFSSTNAATSILKSQKCF